MEKCSLFLVKYGVLVISKLLFIVVNFFFVVFKKKCLLKKNKKNNNNRKQRKQWLSSQITCGFVNTITVDSQMISFS